MTDQQLIFYYKHLKYYKKIPITHPILPSAPPNYDEIIIKHNDL